MIKLPRNRVGIIPVEDPNVSGTLHAYREGEYVPGVGVMGKPVQLITPDVARERTDQGIVKYVGPACEYVVPGDHVIFSGWSGSALEIHDPVTDEIEKLLILPEDFISAIMHDLDRVPISGLYFLGVDGQPFEATYEMAVELIARSVKMERRSRPLPVGGDQRPRVGEYTKMRGG